MPMLADVRQKTIRPIIEATVAKGARVHTDEYGVYAHLPAWGYRHKTVCHVAGSSSSMRATRTATASARSTSTPWRGHGPCCAPGSARTGASLRRSWRSISASSGSCTTPGAEAEPCSVPWSRLSSGDEGAITPDPDKRCPSACRAPPRDGNGATSDGRFWLTLRPADAWRPAVVGGIVPPAHAETPCCSLRGEGRG